MLAQREEMLSIPGCEHVGFGFDRAGQDDVVIRVARYGVDLPRLLGSNNGEALEQTTGRAHAFVAEAQLAGQHAVQLVEDDSGQHQLDPAIDHLFEHSARRPVGDQRRDQDVRVANDAEGQVRLLVRTSSTSRSTSSGPIPRSSARPRP